MAQCFHSSCHKRRGVQTLDAAEVNEATFADTQAHCLPVLLRGAMISLICYSFVSFRESLWLYNKVTNVYHTC